MADPLTAVASEFAPRPSDLFDPRESGDIYNRWANAAQSFDTSKAAFEATRAAEDLQGDREVRSRNKLIFDREDQEYKDKQDFEDAKGELLASVADSLHDDDFEEKISSLLATTPQLADDEAFKTLVNVGAKRAERLRSEKERARQERLQEDEQEASLLKILGAAGADEKFVSSLRDPQTGRINLKHAALAAGQKQYEAATEDDVAKLRRAERDKVIGTFNEDSSLQDHVKAGDPAGVEALIKQRGDSLKAANAAFTDEDLKLSEDAFAAKLAKDLIPDTLSLENEEKARARAAEVKALAKDYHRAHRARSLMGPAAAPAATTKENPAARRYLPTLPKK